MKLLLLIVNNIKKMFSKNAGIICILTAGIIVTSSALNIYYSYSTSLANMALGASHIQRVVDFDISGVNTDFCKVIKEALADGADDINYYCAMSVEDSMVDYIGVESKSPCITIDSGEWIKNGKVVVPYDLYGAKYSVGDEITVKGKNFEVCGVYTPEFYEAQLYSSHRIPISSIALSDMDAALEQYSNTENRYEYSDRAALGLFMTLEDYSSLGLHNDILRVRFNNALSESQKISFGEYLCDYFKSHGMGEISPENNSVQLSAKIYSKEFFSRFLICIFIVLLSLVNTLTLFYYVIQKNQKDSFTYKSLGATDAKIILISCIEYGIYTVIAYSLGFFVSKIIVNISNIGVNASYIGIRQYSVLLAFILVFSLIFVAIFQKRALRKLNNLNDESLFPLHNLAKRLSLKNTYLVLKNYSSSFLREIIIIVQVVCVAFCFTFSATYIFQRGAYEREAKRYMGKDSVAVYIANNQLLELHIKSRRENTSSPSVEQLYADIAANDNITGFGQSRYIRFSFPVLLNESGEPLTSWFNGGYMLNETMIDTFSPRLKSGKWLNEWAQGINYDELGYIPIVITHNISEEYGLSVNDTLDNQIVGLFDTMPENANFTYKVVGILSKNSRVFTNTTYPVSMDTILEPVMKKDSVLEEAFVVYSPEIYTNGNLIESNYGGWPIITYKNASALNKVNEEIEGRGTFYDLSAVVGGMDYLIEEGTSEYTYHIWITSGLLIMGIAGYNLLTLERNRKMFSVYFSCGMPWRKAASIALTANGIIFFIGGIVGSICGVYSTMLTRTIMSDTILYSSLVSIGFVALLFFVSSLLMILKMSKLTPISLIKKGD